MVPMMNFGWFLMVDFLLVIVFFLSFMLVVF
jgi:hypothetical protein